MCLQLQSGCDKAELGQRFGNSLFRIPGGEKSVSQSVLGMETR